MVYTLDQRVLLIMVRSFGIEQQTSLHLKHFLLIYFKFFAFSIVLSLLLLHQGLKFLPELFYLKRRTENVAIPPGSINFLAKLRKATLSFGANRS